MARLYERARITVSKALSLSIGRNWLLQSKNFPVIDNCQDSRLTCQEQDFSDHIFAPNIDDDSQQSINSAY